MGPGSVIGPYAILEEIGRGSNGVVFRAGSPGTGKPIALKVFTAPEAAAALAAIAPRLIALRHPGIVPTLAHGADGDRAWLASELCGGGSLRERLARGPLGAARAAGIATGVLGALAHLHEQGLCHGDVKPENILFTSIDAEQPLLCDVSAAATGAPIDTAPDELLPSWQDLDGPRPGTAAYASPEKLRGEAPAPEHDVFAAGILLFECLTGVRPCGPERPSDVDASLPAQADDAYALLCARRERRPTAAAAADAVARLAEVAKARTERAALPAFRAIALVAPGARVRIRLAESALELATDAKREQPAELAPTEDGALRVVGPAPPREWPHLLALLPEVRVIAVEKVTDGWLVLDAEGEPRLLRAARDAHRFDRIRARRLGRSLVYERHDPTADDTHGAALRDALRRGEEPARAFGRLRASRDQDDPALRAAYDLARDEDQRARATVRIADPAPALPAVRLLARGGGVDPSTLPALD